MLFIWYWGDCWKRSLLALESRKSSSNQNAFIALPYRQLISALFNQKKNQSKSKIDDQDAKSICPICLTLIKGTPQKAPKNKNTKTHDSLSSVWTQDNFQAQNPVTNGAAQSPWGRTLHHHGDWVQWWLPQVFWSLYNEGWQIPRVDINEQGPEVIMALVREGAYGVRL